MLKSVRKALFALTVVIALGAVAHSMLDIKPLPDGLDALAQEADLAAIAEEVNLDSSSMESVVDVLDGFEGVAMADDGLTLTGTDGQEFKVDVDLDGILGRVAEPSGNGTTDLIKYGAFAGILSRILAMARRSFRSLTRL